jgi:nicotinamide mononucleotide (NMN) deamidase PncC
MKRFDGDRAAVRSATVQHALKRLLELLRVAG